MMGRHSVAVNVGTVDADGPASLLPGWDLFVHSVEDCPITVPLRVFLRAERERKREMERNDLIVDV